MWVQHSFSLEALSGGLAQASQSKWDAGRWFSLTMLSVIQGVEAEPQNSLVCDCGTPGLKDATLFAWYVFACVVVLNQNKFYLEHNDCPLRVNLRAIMCKIIYHKSLIRGARLAGCAALAFGSAVDASPAPV